MPCASGPLPPGMLSSWPLTSQTPFHPFHPSFRPCPPGDLPRHTRGPRIFVECLRCSTPPLVPGDPFPFLLQGLYPWESSPAHLLLGAPQCLVPQRHVSSCSPLVWSSLQAMAQRPGASQSCGSTMFNVRLPKILCLSVSNR